MALNDKQQSSRPWALSIALGFLGLILVVGGGYLATIGGSPYYVASGLWLCLTAMLTWQRRSIAAWAYALFIACTILWALYEAGLFFWALLPRIAGPALLGLAFSLPAVRRSLALSWRAAAAGPLLVMASVVILAFGYIVHDFRPGPAAMLAASQDVKGGTEWRAYGGGDSGTHFTPVSQINRGNVGKLKLAWTFRTGDLPEPGRGMTFQATPLKIGDGLYFCTGHNLVFGVDADTGRQLWRYDPRINRQGLVAFTCRGLGYHAGNGSGLCADRLFLSTADNQLVALDRRTGVPCPGFGLKGVVDLTNGILPALPGYYSHTSPPSVIGSVVVVGSLIFDNQSNDEPSGVVRGYDVESGRLVWAWDVLQPKAVKPLAPGEVYPRNTANAWAPFSSDPALGLIYVPTGNTPPDMFGGKRSPAQDRYPSSIVALDAATGNVRWSFQTTHHDVWDYDIPAQVVLTDFPTPQGSVPALIAPTKRGETFILDRRTGKPLVDVRERPVPQHGVPGERLSPTQPFMIGFPSFAGDRLNEASMWGISPIDQMWCRILYRRSRYEGQFTPPSTEGTLIYPAASGAISWGGVAVDPKNRIMLVNTNRLVTRAILVPRVEVDALGVVPYGEETKKTSAAASEHSLTVFAQKGTPYGVRLIQFLSPLHFPCNQPPWGELAAVDLKTRKILWHRPLGTSRDNAPFGLPFPVGVFQQGGAVVTGGGLAFIAGTLDNYIRAFDLADGREMWRARLPAGGQATPMSYQSFRTGRQYVVLAAGGHPLLETKPGDYLLAYALPH